MISGLHEVVRIGAVFEGGWPRPVWMDYNGQKINVKKVFYRWKEKSASINVVKFSFSDGTAIYEIEFNPTDMIWKLTAFDDTKSGMEDD